MLRRLATLACIGGVSACALLADFTYEQTSTMTGGAMMGMMKIAGAFSKQAREPIKTTHIVKGDKMATVAGQRTTVIDLSAETITEIDMQKKQYSVMTFAEMKQMLEEAAQKMKSGDTQANFKVSAEATGATRKINGYDAKQMLIKMEMEVKDPKAGQAGAMNITTESWFASGISGYNEVRDFQKRMAEKVAWSPGGGMMMGRSDIAKGMAAAAKEMAKVDGVPILQMIKMGGNSGANVTPEQQQQTAQAQQAQQEQPQQQRPQAQPSVGGALGGALGGRLGRFGGLGKKKEAPKEEAQQPQQQGTQQAAPAAAPASAPGSGALMEMTVEMTSFSAGPADASKLEIPAGFKKTAPERRR